MLLLFALIAGSSSVWAVEDDVHDMSITQETGLNNNASIPSIEIESPGYPIKQVQVGWKYNKAVDDIVTIEVTIGETSLGTQTVGGKTTSVANFNASDIQGDITISFTNHAGDGTGKGTFYIQSVKLVEGAPNTSYWRATYDYNDGVTANKVVNVNKGDEAAAYTLEAAPTRANFDFLGWNDGTNTYAGGAAYALTSNKTFTAQWEYSGPNTKYNKSSKNDLATGAQYILVGDKSGTKHFALNDLTTGHLYFGSSAVSNANSSIDDAKAIIVDETPLVLTLEETEDGWYLKNSTGKKLGMSGDKQMNWDAGDITWVLDGTDDTPSFKATYNTSNYTLYYNSSATRFNGYTSKGSNVYTYYYRLDDGNDIYTLTLDVNDGATPATTHRVLQGATYTLPIPTRSGYHFAGWNTVEGGTGTNYPAGGYTMPAAATTLYAQWETSQTITIASSGYSTLATTCGLDFASATPAGLEAYVASAVTASGVTLAAVDEAPASTGVILKGTAGATYTIPVKAAAAAVGTNKLKAAVSAYNCAANEVYILKGGKFCKVTAASTVPAGKAYLLASDVPASAPELEFNFGGTTAIDAIQKQTKNGEFYNLAGQRVANPSKGLYIVNGKKVVIK